MGDDYRDLSLQAWEAAAAGWARWSGRTAEMTRRVTEWLLERLAPQPGQTILELAAGTGDTGYLAAQRAGGDVRLITTDFSSTMLEQARRRGEELGVEAEHRVMDAERMELAEDSIDGVICRYGYMLMGDPAAALRETRRVLRPGGRVVFAVWGAPERNEWASVVGRTLVEHGVLPPPEPGQPGIFALANQDRLRALLSAAGFREPVLEEIELTLGYRDFADYWDFLTKAAGAVSGVLAALPPEQRDEIREAVQARLASSAGADGRLEFAGVSLNGVAS